MNGKTGGNQGPRRAAALAVVAAVAAATAACGVVHVHIGSSGGPAPAGPAAYRADLAYAHCMQTHGLPGFPNPSPSGGPSFQLNSNPNSPAARANDACEHLLPAGSTRTVTGAYISETAWSNPGNQPSASGGGFSRLFARPAYQDGVPGIGAMRGVPDVAAAWEPAAPAAF